MPLANDIAVPVGPPPMPDVLAPNAPEADVNAILEEIRFLLEACGANGHDRADVAISALIDRGINDGRGIVAAAQKLGFDARHAGIMLRNGIGIRWARDDAGRYLNLI